MWYAALGKNEDPERIILSPLAALHFDIPPVCANPADMLAVGANASN